MCIPMKNYENNHKLTTKLQKDAKEKSTGRREGSSLGDVVLSKARSRCGGRAAGGLLKSRSDRKSCPYAEGGVCEGFSKVETKERGERLVRERKEI